MDYLATQLSSSLAGRYEIERLAGAGGMATVYLARDVRHDRPVALKVLNPELGAVLGVERFLAEIKVTANLQHPNLLPLFDSGEADGLLFYVMPYVEGESLRARLEREKQLPVDEAIRIAVAVGSALDYAHRHGVIHRDLKPDNILLQDGEPLIADFGIALAVSNAGGHRITQTGISLGTPQYMSPEQATGDRQIDGRTDIYSLAAVLYEMLSGDPPHAGSTAQAVIARVLTDRPREVRASRPTVPPHVSAAVDRALEKLPADRFSTAREFTAALQARAAGGVAAVAPASEGPSSAARPAGTAGGSYRRYLPWALAALFGVAAIWGWSSRWGAAADAPTARFTVELPEGQRLGAPYGVISISHDGRTVALAARRGDTARLYLRSLDQLEWRELARRSDLLRPSFAPDGRSVLAQGDNQTRVYSLDGSAPVELHASHWDAGVFDEDGNLYFSPAYNAGIHRLRAGERQSEALTQPDSARNELAHWNPVVLPGRGAILFTNFSMPLPESRVEVLSLGDGKRKVLVEGAMDAAYAAGFLFFMKGDVLHAAPFDTRKLELRAPPQPVLQDVSVMISAGKGSYAISESGTLAYVPGKVVYPPTELVWVSRTGEVRPAITRAGDFAYTRLAPDGKRIAVGIQENGIVNLHVYEPDREIFSRITSHLASVYNPVWSRDGDELFYSVERPAYDLFRRVSDAARPEALVLSSAFDKRATDISSDGNALLFEDALSDGRRIAAVDLDGDRESRALIPDEGDQRSGRLSPNGRWIAYSLLVGSSQIYVRSYPDVSRVRRQVSTQGGSQPRWTRGGREIVYSDAQRIMSVSFDPETGAVGRPTMVLEWPHSLGGFDVTADGERFLLARPAGGEQPQHIVVVTNWLDEVRRRFK
jgi:eukaryotic-like serine/threonine-protein kinase